MVLYKKIASFKFDQSISQVICINYRLYLLNVFYNNPFFTPLLYCPSPLPSPHW